jgi:hypothetical protein
MAPAVGDQLTTALPPGPVPGFDVIAVQPFWTLAPGCSGNVDPGAPASPNAGAAPTAIRAPATRMGTMRRFMTSRVRVCPLKDPIQEQVAVYALALRTADAA